MTGRHTPARRFVPYTERASISDLHYRLGKLVEDGPGFLVADGGHRVNTNRHHFEGIEPVRGVDMAACERLQEFAAERRQELGEAKWRELEAEWNADA